MNILYLQYSSILYSTIVYIVCNKRGKFSNFKKFYSVVYGIYTMRYINLEGKIVQ